MTTPTAALVEEAEKITEGVPADWTACSCNKCGLVWALGEMHIATVELETRESDCAQPSPEQRRRIMDFMSRSRSMIPELASALRRAEAERDAALKQSAAWEIQAQDMRDRLIKAEAERDAQHALVLRLTAERDEAKADAVRMLTAASQQAITSARIAADLNEARAQVWGLICAGSNMAERRRYFQGLWETLLADGLKRDAQLSELTATRDLLTKENARLQERVATLELLRRGGR